VEVRSRAEWRGWLEEHHTQTASVWAVTYKKPHEWHVPYADLVEEALCFGWVDSRAGTLDAERTMLVMAPRRKGSNWSKLNKERVARLEAAGLMTEAGRVKIQAAQADGTWDALNDVDALVVPEDFAKELKRVKDAKRNYEKFPPSARRAILEWLLTAKTEETRRKRVKEGARLAGVNVRANTKEARDYCAREASTK
jgi:uncharacterized protein YdeI (YjbR/CyaY-like superfamily)